MEGHTFLLREQKVDAQKYEALTTTYHESKYFVWIYAEKTQDGQLLRVVDIYERTLFPEIDEVSRDGSYPDGWTR